MRFDALALAEEGDVVACALVFALVGWMSSLADIPEKLLSSLLKDCVSGLVVDTSPLLYLTPSLLRSFAPSFLLASLVAE